MDPRHRHGQHPHLPRTRHAGRAAASGGSPPARAPSGDPRDRGRSGRGRDPRDRRRDRRARPGRTHARAPGPTTLETAVRYQLWHALALFAVVLVGLLRFWHPSPTTEELVVAEGAMGWPARPPGGAFGAR